MKVRVVPAASVAGHAAFWIDETASDAGISVKANALITSDGTDVYGLEDLGVQTAAPSSPSPSTLMVKLIARVRAIR